MTPRDLARDGAALLAILLLVPVVLVAGVLALLLPAPDEGADETGAGAI